MTTRVMEEASGNQPVGGTILERHWTAPNTTGPWPDPNTTAKALVHLHTLFRVRMGGGPPGEPLPPAPWDDPLR
jgi:hypothetical protein